MRTPQNSRRRRSLPVRVLALSVVGLLVLVGVSLGRALLAPGTDSTAARAAEWARAHGLSGVVDWAERTTYQAPAVGGGVKEDSPLAASPAKVLAGPARFGSIQPLASPPLPHEGEWQVLATVAGRPALQVAYLRPDAVHTSYTAAVARMDTTLLKFVLHPGTQEPGGRPWKLPPVLTSSERPSLLAAFNGGFRLDAARGGFLEQGRLAGRLRTGAASLVISTDGRATVGKWGSDVLPSASVAAVRQNLDLIVDAGQVVPGLDNNAHGRWGRTLGNKLYVWRSGVGVASDGALLYAAGNRLSASSLAELLRRAGSVRAMELDINPEWTSFVTYPSPANLLPDMQRSPHRYDSTSTRDFVAVLRRSA